MHNLLGSKVILCTGLLLFLCSSTLWAQREVQEYAERMAGLRNQRNIMVRGMNKPNYDEKFLHYGFYLGTNFNTFSLRRSPYLSEQLNDQNLWDSTLNQPLAGVQPVGSVGMNIGFILNMGTDIFPWMSYFDLRFLPNVSFYQRHVEYRFQDDSRVRMLNQSTYSYIELPLLIKYKSKRRNNVRMYMLAGIKPALEVGNRREDLTEEFLRINTSDFSIDYGFGVEMFYPYFNLAPEIRFSHGISNMWTRDPNIYSRSLNAMYTHTVTLILNFEG